MERFTMNIRSAFNQYQSLENTFWSGLEKDVIDYNTYSGELQVIDMYLYGEFGFALLGLKPCVLVDFRSKDTIQQYANQVIEPVLNSLKGRNLSWMKIENTSTPECDLNDCILVYNINQTELVNEIFLSTNRSKVIPEDTLARLLDYPGKLPSSPEDVRLMKTVIYYHQTVDTKELVAVTTYAMLDYEKEKVISHFKRYQSICETALGMQLRLLIR